MKICSVHLTVNKLAIKHAIDGSLIRRYMHKLVMEEVADNLSRDAIKQVENSDSIDYSIQVYVVTPNQLEEYVKRRIELHNTQVRNKDAKDKVHTS
jgi:hypothetical protein